jgi:type IV pilus assembly protein PilA
MLNKVQKGFTLIELMIVVAIIGILAAIAIPAYQDYVIRSQVSEGLTLASSVKASVAEYFADRGQWPATNADLGITSAPSGKYVSSVTVEDGTITITYGNDANSAIAGANNTMSLKPLVSTNLDVVWQCGDNAPTSTSVGEYSGGGSGAVPTSLVLGKYRPSNCRG